MKLIRCHIENFGCLHDWDATFDGGIHTVLLPNGAGKSTLAAFLFAMLYGMDPYTNSTKGFPERKHYYPFNNGKFGGTLELESGKERYVIERYFGKKSDKDDTMTVYDGQNRKTEKLSPVPGEALFSIGRDTFRRTVFVTEPEKDGDVEPELASRLGHWVEGTGSGEDYAAAKERLLAAQKRLHSERRQHNAFTGAIPETEEEIARLESDLANLRNREEALGQHVRLMQEMQTELDNLNEKKKQATALAARLADWDVYDAYRKRAEEARAMQSAILENYPGGLPEHGELEALAALRDEQNMLDGRRSGTVFSAEKEARREELARRFAPGVPDEAAFRAAEDLLSSIAEAERAENSVSVANDERANDLGARFASGVPEEAKLSAAAEALDRIREAETLLQTEATLPPAPGKASGKPFAIPAVIAALLAAGGGVLCAFSLLFGILLCAVGVAALLLCGFLYLNRKSRPAAPAEDPLAASRAEARAAIARDKRAVGDFLWQYNYRSPDLAADLALLRRDVADFARLETEARAAAETRENARREADALAARLAAFLSPYALEDGTPAEQVRALHRAAEEFERLSAERKEAVAAQRTLAEDFRALSSRVEAILAPYGIRVESTLADLIASLLSARTQLDAARAEEARAKSAAEKEKTDRNLTERPEPMPDYDADETEAEIHRLQGELANRRALRDADERALEAREEKERLLDEAREKLQSLQEKRRILKLASEVLDKAENNLVSRYVDPVKNGYLSYAALLDPEITDGMEMDASLHALFTRDGEARSDLHFSTGLRALFALCLRLSLLDRMFETEAPFLLLDDPFVYLDSAHMERIKPLLQSLAKDRQILYFCCHESRALPTA